jgi:hypothetical protein
MHEFSVRMERFVMPPSVIPPFIVVASSSCKETIFFCDTAPYNVEINWCSIATICEESYNPLYTAAGPSSCNCGCFTSDLYAMCFYMFLEAISSC